MLFLFKDTVEKATVGWWKVNSSLDGATEVLPKNALNVDSKSCSCCSLLSFPNALKCTSCADWRSLTEQRRVFLCLQCLPVHPSVCLCGRIQLDPLFSLRFNVNKVFQRLRGVLEPCDTSQVFRQNTITSPLIFKKSFLFYSQNLMQPSTSEWSRASDCDEGSSWPVGERKWIIIFQWHGQIVHEVW